MVISVPVSHLEALRTIVLNLEACPEEEFAVAFGAENWRSDYVGANTGQVHQRSLHLLDRGCLSGLVAHNTALAHEFPSGFELRLDQDDHLPAVALLGRRREGGAYYGRQNRGRGNKRHVDHDEVYVFANRFSSHIACVGFFQESNARILAQLEIHLPVTRVDRDHASCAVLQQAIGEPTGGGADVEANSARNIYIPVLKGAFKFQSAAANILQIFAEQPDRRVGQNLGAGFLDLLVVNQHFPRENQGLGAFS